MPGLWSEVLAVIRRYPFAATAPAAVLGAGAAGLQFLDRDLVVLVPAGIALVIVFELYVAYLERLVVEFEDGSSHVSVVRLLRRAMPMVPALVAASLIGVTLPLAASGLLILPGLWLATRWSLFASVISKEGAGPIAAIRRSNELVRGHFWPVFTTVTLSLLVENAVIHGTALAAGAQVDRQLVALIGAGVVVAAISPPAGLSISIAYNRLADSPRTGG